MADLTATAADRITTSRGLDELAAERLRGARERS
jgi:hypothetical protein